MFTWSQSRGEMTDDSGAVVGTGYAGRDEGFNNEAMQNVPDVGPLPRGRYTIGPLLSSYTIGNVVLQWCSKLIPDPANEMFGRAGFLIHGRKSLTDLSASEGCVVLDHGPRMVVLESLDRDLVVVE